MGTNLLTFNDTKIIDTEEIYFSQDDSKNSPFMYKFINK